MMSFNIQFESEKSVFKCILINSNLLYDIDIEWLSVKGREVYNALEFLIANHKSLTANNIIIQINDEDINDFINELFNENDIDVRDFDVYKERLKLDYAREQISTRLSTDLKILVNKRGELDFKKIEELSDLLEKNLDLIKSKRAVIPTISDVISRYKDEIKKRLDGKFYSYGDAELDKITSGAQPGEITTIFAPTSMGKSAYALNLFNKEINKRIPSVYFTLEMDEISTMDRLISLRTGIPASDLSMKNADTDQKFFINDVINAEIEKLKKMSDWMAIVDEPGLKLSDFENQIIKLKKRMGVDYLIVFVDLWTMFADIKAEASDIEMAINLSSNIVKRQNIHLIAIVQANREADKKPVSSIEMIPNMKIRNINNIKNSASIGERSRTVLSVFRGKKIAELYFPDNPLTEIMDDIFEVTVLKCSNGKVGSTVKYIYQPECFKVTPYIEEDKVVSDYE